MRFQEGRAWFSVCPVLSCERPVIEAHVGFKLRLNTKAVPFKDALILWKYDRFLINVWVGTTQLWAVDWHKDLGKPERGHLYAQHIHGRRL